MFLLKEGKGVGVRDIDVTHFSPILGTEAGSTIQWVSSGHVNVWASTCNNCKALWYSQLIPLENAPDVEAQHHCLKITAVL